MKELHSQSHLGKKFQLIHKIDEDKRSIIKRRQRRDVTFWLEKEFKELYEGGESSERIGKKFDFDHNIVLRHLRKLDVKIRNRSEACKLALMRGVFTVPPPKINKIPKSSRKLTIEKAYILGVLCGDGSMHCTKNNSYQIMLSVTDEEFANEFLKCIKNVYKLTPTKKLLKMRNPRWQDQFFVRLCSKETFKDLQRYHKTFKTFEWKIPKHIFSSDMQIKAKFLQGFFDSEGNVDFKHKRVSGYSSNYIGLKQVENLLNLFSIRTSVRTMTRKIRDLNLRYCLNINDRRSLDIFAEYIGFTIKRKRESLKKITNSYSLFVTPNKEVKKFAPDMIILRKSGLSYEKIADQLSIATMTVWNHINKYK